VNTCCEDKACDVEVLRERQSGTLRVVLSINVVLFLVGATAGFRRVPMPSFPTPRIAWAMPYSPLSPSSSYAAPG
jgi:hypothetical protein